MGDDHHDRAAVRFRGMAAAALLLLAAGCGDGSPLSGAPGDAAAPPFAGREVTWAQGDRIHYGHRTMKVRSQRTIHELRPAAHGFFVLLGARGRDTVDAEWHFFDGSTLTGLGDEVDSVRVSPDGRYAGWVDRHGPLRPAGRIAKVVVVDIASGEVLLEDHSGMGGGFGDDLEARYSELEPTFLGFDDDYAYWTNAVGHGTRMRWHRSTGVVDSAEAGAGGPVSGAPGHPYDAYAGRPVGLVEGRPEGDGGVSGSVSPDGRYAAETGFTGRLRLYDEDGVPVPVDLGHRFAFFGGWLDGQRFYALTRDTFENGYDPTAPDRTRGWLTTCSLRTGACRDAEGLVGTWRVVLPGSSPSLL